KTLPISPLHKPLFASRLSFPHQSYSKLFCPPGSCRPSPQAQACLKTAGQFPQAHFPWYAPSASLPAIPAFPYLPLGLGEAGGPPSIIGLPLPKSDLFPHRLSLPMSLLVWSPL